MAAPKSQCTATVTKESSPVSGAIVTWKQNGVTKASGSTNVSGQCTVGLDYGTYDVTALLPSEYGSGTLTQTGCVINTPTSQLAFGFD